MEFDVSMIHYIFVLEAAWEKLNILHDFGESGH